MGHQSSLNHSPGSTRIQFESARTAAGVGGGLLWLGFFRGVRVVGGGGFGRFVVFLAPWRAWAVCRLAIKAAVSPRAVSGLI